MKKIFTLFVFFTVTAFSQQWDLRGSLGINFITTPSLRDYLNQQYRSGEELSTFNSAVNFSGETNYYFSPTFAGGIEVAYVLNSFNFTSDIGKRELKYIFIMPSLTAYYVLAGTGYNFKFGGGAGPRFATVEETVNIYSVSHKSTGFGLLLKAEGNTSLGGNLYANIGGDLRYDLNGSFKTVLPEEINLDAFSFGLRLGVTYIFQ